MHLLGPEPVDTLEDYIRLGGGQGLHQAVEIGPQATIDEVSRSGLRGRGGGGFPTGRKWGGVAGAEPRRYLVANGAEGEPGTFKDRALMRANPYQLVEGVMIAAYAIGAAEAFICLKASFELERAAVAQAIAQMQDAGLCTECRITVVGGPDEYLFGEEKAMLEVIEGKEPLPRVLPPYEHGLFASLPQTGWSATASDRDDGQSANPTVVNNVETLSHVTHILARGADWFRSTGTDESPGTIVCTVVGDMERAGVGEFALGTPLSEVLTTLGRASRSGERVKAVCSGVANAVVTADDLDVPVSFEGFSAIGSGMGSAGFIVFTEHTCMVEVARRYSQFLHVESCGQCPACKTGSAEITARLQRLEGGGAEPHDLDEIAGWLRKVTDGNRCYLAVEERIVVLSILQAFANEVNEHISLGHCPRPRPVVLPKLVDIVDGVATYDEAIDRKRPDWTYEPAE